MINMWESFIKNTCNKSTRPSSSNIILNNKQIKISKINLLKIVGRIKKIKKI